MVEPEAVAAMLRLKELGWGTKRIARELGVSRGTVKGHCVGYVFRGRSCSSPRLPKCTRAATECSFGPRSAVIRIRRPPCATILTSHSLAASMQHQLMCLARGLVPIPVNLRGCISRWVRVFGAPTHALQQPKSDRHSHHVPGDAIDQRRCVRAGPVVDHAGQPATQRHAGERGRDDEADAKPASCAGNSSRMITA
jgi:hypothetical protein